MKATPKVMPPVLLYWPTVSEADVWWYGSRSWTFPPVFCYILFLCHRQQLRGSLTQHCVTWKCVWSRCVSLNSSIQKKMAPIDTQWCLLNTDGDQTVGGSTARRWGVRCSSGDSDSSSPLLVQIFMTVACSSCSSVAKVQSYWWWLRCFRDYHVLELRLCSVK